MDQETVIAALVVSLASVGLAVWAVARTPENGHAGLRGAEGPRGLQGQPGVQGVAGAPGHVGLTGATGKQAVPGPKGSPGTVRSTEVISGAAVQSAPNPLVGTMLSANTPCPLQTVLLSGGATVSSSEGMGSNVELRSSSPASSSVWRAVAEVTGVLGSGHVMILKPFVLCGVD
jgi:hypothetical protein